MTIHLGRELLHGSSNLPGGKTGHLIAALFGFAPNGACLARTVARPAGELLPHPFTLTAKPGVSRRSSLCCACPGLPPLGIAQHSALWSPDFPLGAKMHPAVIRPAPSPVGVGPFYQGRRRKRPIFI